MTLKRDSVSVSGPALKPSTATEFPQLLPASKGTVALVTPVTPGSALSSSSTFSYNCSDRSGV
jgi:hypothetical protein